MPEIGDASFFDEHALEFFERMPQLFPEIYRLTGETYSLLAARMPVGVEGVKEFVWSHDRSWPKYDENYNIRAYGVEGQGGTVWNYQVESSESYNRTRFGGSETAHLASDGRPAMLSGYMKPDRPMFPWELEILMQRLKGAREILANEVAFNGRIMKRHSPRLFVGRIIMANRG
ncbi:MAG TPA: hypothetical protein VLG47_05100 [Candidatus Saccharimonadales bacterium]|nr:hypothetical protein [Candidatus Saccharimonadales bacterium]